MDDFGVPGVPLFQGTSIDMAYWNPTASHVVSPFPMFPAIGNNVPLVKIRGAGLVYHLPSCTCSEKVEQTLCESTNKWEKGRRRNLLVWRDGRGQLVWILGDPDEIDVAIEGLERDNEILKHPAFYLL